MDEENKIKNNDVEENNNVENSESSSNSDNNSNLTNESINMDKNPTNNGNWFSRQSTAVKVILGLVGICCIGVIIVFAIGSMVPGGIDYQFNTNNTGSADTFPTKVTVEGLTFYMPEGFQNIGITNTTQGTKAYRYSDGEDYITVTVFTSLSISQALNNLKSNPAFTNFTENTEYGTYSGFTANYLIEDRSGNNVPGKIFFFERGGRLVSIEMSIDNNLNFDTDVLKIMG